MMDEKLIELYYGKMQTERQLNYELDIIGKLTVAEQESLKTLLNFRFGNIENC